MIARWTGNGQENSGLLFMHQIEQKTDFTKFFFAKVCYGCDLSLIKPNETIFGSLRSIFGPKKLAGHLDLYLSESDSN